MYSRHRFPAEIISYCVWLYYTFPLSYRDIEKMMLYCGIEVTYESIREWCQKFGQQYANQVRRKRPYLTDRWHLDEVVITIKGKQYYLWRAVDSEGNVLDILMQRHRDTKAAKRFFRKLLKQQGFAPRVIVTDKLKSYEVAKNQMFKRVEHRQHKGLNNRAENSHQPPRTLLATHAEVYSRQGKPNAFSLPLDRFETTSTPSNIYSPLTAIGKKCVNELRIGEKLWD